jgi:putative tryptophan/tyrosine transport system substrate-binding protein
VVPDRQCEQMRLRDFITFLAGCLAAWPVGTSAQVRSMPVIGFLHSQSSGASHLDVARFHEGLNEEGYVDGKNVLVEYRWGNNDLATLPALAAELVQRRVTLIFTDGGLVAARAARAASTATPIVFVIGMDPAENGFVASLNRPGGNATGVLNYNRELVPKRLELLRELVGPSTKIAYLMNADDTNLGPGAKKQIEDEKIMARRLMDLVLDARTEDQIAPSFAAAARQGIGALLVEADPLFTNRRNLLVTLAAQYRLPAGYQPREFVDAGGLMSYGASRAELLRQAGAYAGRILKGANPAEMPVLTPTKFNLVINLKTAKTLGLTIPASLLVSADEIIK